MGFLVHGFKVCMTTKVNSWNVSTELKKKINGITAVHWFAEHVIG
jgi:hypothetical protein